MAVPYFSRARTASLWHASASSSACGGFAVTLKQENKCLSYRAISTHWHTSSSLSVIPAAFAARRAGRNALGMPGDCNKLLAPVNTRCSMVVLAAPVLMMPTMAATEPNVTLYQLQENCENLAAETFRRETANDEDRVDYRAHHNARLKKCFYVETYISPTPVGTNRWVYLSDYKREHFAVAARGQQACLW